MVCVVSPDGGLCCSRLPDGGQGGGSIPDGGVGGGSLPDGGVRGGRLPDSNRGLRSSANQSSITVGDTVTFWKSSLVELWLLSSFIMEHIEE